MFSSLLRRGLKLRTKEKSKRNRLEIGEQNADKSKPMETIGDDEDRTTRTPPHNASLVAELVFECPLRPFNGGYGSP
jgi:hypothetical protein